MLAVACWMCSDWCNTMAHAPLLNIFFVPNDRKLAVLALAQLLLLLVDVVLHKVDDEDVFL